MNSIEITFKQSGNTIVGNYTVYAQLDKAIEAKAVFVPFGCVITGEESDIRRLTEYVQLFGNCIKTKAAFANACKLADVEFHGCDLNAVNESAKDRVKSSGVESCAK